MQKKDRHKTILDLISGEPIGRQDVLAAKLGECGYAVTQASVSRDLEELGITKVNGIYAFPRSFAAPELGLRSLEPAGDDLVVCKCDSGLASAITVRIDAAGIAEIVGTIAGDDTIFIAVNGAENQAAVIQKIRGLFS